MSGDDAAWVLDMLIACEKIERFIRGMWEIVTEDAVTLKRQLEQLVPRQE